MLLRCEFRIARLNFSQQTVENKEEEKQKNTTVPPCFFLFSHLNDFHQHTESPCSYLQFHWPRTDNLLSPSPLDEKLRLQKPWSEVKSNRRRHLSNHKQRADI